MEKIKITVLECGSVSLRPREAYIKDGSLLSPRTKLPVNVFLIEHPVHGRILVDTGWSYDVNDILPERLRNFYKPEIRDGESAKDRLAALGISPSGIDTVLLSHLDVDHTCALGDFAGKAGRIVCSELEYFYSCRTVYKLRQVWDTWMPFVSAENRISYRASVLGPVGRGFDLFGDDSVLCIYTPGHTDGSFTIIVNSGQSNRFKAHGDGLYGGDFAVLACDNAFSQRNIDGGIVPGYGFDQKQQANALNFLKNLQSDPHHQVTLFSHSPFPSVCVTLG